MNELESAVQTFPSGPRLLAALAEFVSEEARHHLALAITPVLAEAATAEQNGKHAGLVTASLCRLKEFPMSHYVCMLQVMLL